MASILETRGADQVDGTTKTVERTDTEEELLTSWFGVRENWVSTSGLSQDNNDGKEKIATTGGTVKGVTS